MDSWNLAVENLTSPPVLAFVLGALAVVLKSDVRLPDPIHTWLSTYLLLAIGLKGGHALKGNGLGDLVLPAVITVAIGILVPVAIFGLCRVMGETSQDAASMAAHYGSVSAVTFTAAMTFATAAGYEPEGYMTALVALLEIPGIVVALILASRGSRDVMLSESFREVMTGRSVLLLVGGLAIGALSSEKAFAKVEPFFVQMFSGLLALFLLDMGGTVARRVREYGWPRFRMVSIAVIAPVLSGTAGVLAATTAGFSIGGAGVFGVMVASASYIAAPAAVRIALPNANNSGALVCALGVTFPFNLVVGIPLLFGISEWIGG